MNGKKVTIMKNVEEAISFFRQMQEESMKHYHPRDVHGRKVIQYFEKAVRALEIVEELEPLHVKVAIPFEKYKDLHDVGHLTSFVYEQMSNQISNYIVNIMQIRSHDEEELRLKIFNGDIIIYNPPEKGVIE